jgi:hypothetical protein
MVVVVVVVKREQGCSEETANNYLVKKFHVYRHHIIQRFSGTWM